MKNIIKELNDLKSKLKNINEICNDIFKDEITKENENILLEQAIKNINDLLNNYDYFVNQKNKK